MNGFQKDWLDAVFLLRTAHFVNVRYWHLADIKELQLNVGFQG